MTLDLSHLSTAVRERAFDSNQDRIRQVKVANWVGYARANRALERLDEMIEQPSCARMPCLLLYGESGMGKTMIVEKFERMHPPRHDRKSGIESRPVIIIQFPSGPDERRFFVRILHGLGAPYSAYWRIDALERAAMNAMALVHVQILIVEEFQQRLAGSAREQRISLNLIKSIANDLRISVVGVGTDEARYAIEADKQIRRRFDPFSPTPMDRDRRLPRLRQRVWKDLSVTQGLKPRRTWPGAASAAGIRRHHGTAHSIIVAGGGRSDP
jgi:hypothetical protein